MSAYSRSLFYLYFAFNVVSKHIDFQGKLLGIVHVSLNLIYVTYKNVDCLLIFCLSSFTEETVSLLSNFVWKMWYKCAHWLGLLRLLSPI